MSMRIHLLVFFLFPSFLNVLLALFFFLIKVPSQRMFPFSCSSTVLDLRESLWTFFAVNPVNTDWIVLVKQPDIVTKNKKTKT